MAASFQSLMPVLVINGQTAASGSAFNRRVDLFVRLTEQAAKDAAQTAQRTAVQTLGPNKRPSPGPRRGRNQSNRLKTVLRYQVDRDLNVYFDESKANAQNPYWIIQEIGTGQRAVARKGGTTNPRGRASRGSTYVRTVPAQSGRQISYALAWGDRSGTYAHPNNSVSNQQLQLVSRLKNVPSVRKPLVIGEEIKGRHFIRDGSTQGFRKYQTSVLAAARQAFAKRP